MKEWRNITYVNGIMHTRTQLSAHNVGVLYPPAGITHCSPRVVVEDFHIATGKGVCVIRSVSAIDQPNWQVGRW